MMLLKHYVIHLDRRPDMDSPDQNFVNEYKPLHVPHKYDAGASIQDKVIYALSQLGNATALQVADELYKSEPQTKIETHQKNANEVLKGLFEKGLIKGDDDKAAGRKYNLSKILVPNSGKADDLY